MVCGHFKRGRVVQCQVWRVYVASHFLQQVEVDGVLFLWLSSWSLWAWLPCQEVSQSKYTFPYRWVAFFQVMIWGSMLLPSVALPSSRFSEQMRKMNYTSQKSHTGTNEDHFSSHYTGKTIACGDTEMLGCWEMQPHYAATSQVGTPSHYKERIYFLEEQLLVHLYHTSPLDFELEKEKLCIPIASQ